MTNLKKYKATITMVGILVFAVIAGFSIRYYNLFSADQSKKTGSEKVSPTPAPVATNEIIVKSSKDTRKIIETQEQGNLTIKSENSNLGTTLYEINVSNATADEELKKVKAILLEKQPKEFKDKKVFAELNMKYAPALVPNDPWYANWEWHLKKINGPSAWDITGGSPNTIIAILDSGVENTHEDLSSKLIPGWNTYNNSADTSDQYGHGTLVSGTAAAITNNSRGVASVCWTCKIMPMRISDGAGYATDIAAADALTWAADHGARVANISYTMWNNYAVDLAAQYFRSKGGVVVTSAGNSGATYTEPDDPDILTVGASDPNDQITSYSNIGPFIDIVAPGSSYTTIKGNGYYAASGTSVSAPIVAGVAGLIISSNPNLTAIEIENIIKSTAKDLGSAGYDTSYGWGRVDAYSAVLKASGGTPPPPTADTTPPTAPTNLKATATSSSAINLSWTASTDNVGVKGYQIYRNNIQVGSTSTTAYADTGLIASATYSYFVKAVDTAGNVSSSSNVASATTQAQTLSILSMAVTAKTATSANITIVTSAPTTITVNYGTSKTNLNLSKSDATSATTHTITLTGLTKNTVYYYTTKVTSTDGKSITSSGSLRTKSR